ncbi:MAG: DUF6431 domain-containing protein [Desulfitobacteriaceae bacterium]
MVVTKHFTSFCGTNADVIFIKSVEKLTCPVCGGELICISSCNRKGMRDNDQINVYRLRKLRCKQCQKIHLELPYFLIPRKRYEADIYQLILEGKDDGISCDDYTKRDTRKWAIIYLTKFLSLHGLSVPVDVCSINYLKDLINETKLILPEENWLAKVCYELYVHTRKLFMEQNYLVILK